MDKLGALVENLIELGALLLVLALIVGFVAAGELLLGDKMRQAPAVDQSEPFDPGAGCGNIRLDGC